VWRRVVLWLVFGILLVLGFRQANSIQQFSGVSLRFNEPISGQAAHRARQHSIENAEQETFWLTFWYESTAELSAGVRTVQANAISFSGDAALVWTAQYLVGTAPSSLDGSGIAVSEALAHRLWGSTDIVGMPVYVNEKPRIVRGVFEGNFELALLSFHIEDTQQSWTAVELSGGESRSTRSNAESFAIAAGLGAPDYILMGGAMAVATFMSMLPLLIFTMYVLVLLILYVKKHYRSAATPIMFLGLIVFAILLPILLNALPAWLIPTHWSDFSFWSSLLQQASGSLREFLSVNPMLRDVELRMLLLGQVGIMVLSISCVIFCLTKENVVE